MKIKISKVIIPIRTELSLTGKEEDCEYYVVEYKFHWWQRYRFVYDPMTHVPRLFENGEEINEFFDSMGFKKN